MRTSRLRYPKPKDIAIVTRTLAAAVPMDKPIESGWRESEKLIPNLRCQSITSNRQWYVDIYAGHFYVVGVAGRMAEVCNNVPSIVSYLCRMLGVRPRTSITG